MISARRARLRICGGWAKPLVAMRYMHVAAADLAEDVRAYGWEMRAGAAQRPLAVPAPVPTSPEKDTA